MINDDQLKKLKEKDKVAYLPPHKLLSEAEVGYVSSVNIKANFVYVKFQKYLYNQEWEAVTSQACNPSHLTLLTNGQRNKKWGLDVLFK